MRNLTVHGDKEGTFRACVPFELVELRWGEIGIESRGIGYAVRLIKEEPDGEDGGKG